MREAVCELAFGHEAGRLAATPFYITTYLLVAGAYLISVLVPSIYVSLNTWGGEAMSAGMAGLGQRLTWEGGATVPAWPGPSLLAEPRAGSQPPAECWLYPVLTILASLFACVLAGPPGAGWSHCHRDFLILLPQASL